MRFLMVLLILGTVKAFAQSAIDSDGRRVTLKAPAKRIISLAPHTTEQLFAAGAGERIVGVSEYSDYPEEAKRLPRVASSGTVNLEMVLSLKPDLVVAWRLEATSAALKRLESLDIPVFYSEPHRLAHIPDMIEALGELAGTGATARPLARSLRAEIGRIESEYGSRRTITVFYQISERPLMTLGGSHFVSDAIDLCGGRNIFAGSTVMAPVVNIESVIAADPVAILTARPDPRDRTWEAFWRRFPGLFAVETDNLYTVPTNEMHRHGPRAIAAARLLCERIDEARVRAATRR
jgi:iron complex transport system substrate-binding protein